MTAPGDARRSGVASLRRLLTARLRRTCAGRALANAAIAAALAVTGLEAAARVVHLPARVTLEAAAVLAAAGAAVVQYLRARPAERDWREAADRIAAEPGIF